jgi:ribosomal protein L40E
MAWLETDSGLQLLRSSSCELLVTVLCSRCNASGWIAGELCRECGGNPLPGRHLFRVGVARLIAAIARKDIDAQLGELRAELGAVRSELRELRTALPDRRGD